MGEGDPQGIAQEAEIWPYEQVVYTQHVFYYLLENETRKIVWDFKIQTTLLISTRLSDMLIVAHPTNNLKKHQPTNQPTKQTNQKTKKRTCLREDFAVLE